MFFLSSFLFVSMRCYGNRQWKVISTFMSRLSWDQKLHRNMGTIGMSFTSDVLTTFKMISLDRDLIQFCSDSIDCETVDSSKKTETT